MNGRRGQRNGTTLCLLTNPASACITMVGFKFGDIVVRGCGTVALCIATLILHLLLWLRMVMDFPGHTPLVYIAGTLNSQLYIYEVLEPCSSYTFSACHQPCSNRIMRDHIKHAMFENSSLAIRLNCFLGLLFLPIYRQSKTCGPCLHNH
ncbi:hypothetical protein TNCV_534601 [Trichonephila clavipes]|nr:hypothetical protein TNCV_534601 [Trichonephila clavipes]